MPQGAFVALQRVPGSARKSLCAHVLGSPLQSLGAIVLNGHKEDELLPKKKNDLILEFFYSKSKYHQDEEELGDLNSFQGAVL